jgi:type II secretory ATPase GspE/PulE/Tfp pilus assembly ATPase PilB-like protein
MDKTYLLDIIIADAYLKGVTEILLDGSAAPGKKNVFFRMGSALKGYMEIPGDAANGIIKRLKYMAGHDAEVNHIPRIGRILFKRKGLPELNLIIKICTTTGLEERATLRIRST